MSLESWWNRTRYRVYAPIYDWVAQPLEQGRRLAINRLALSSDERILILGSGPGSDLPHLPYGSDITAIDAAPEMVERTAARAEQLGHNVEARVGDAQNLDLPDDSFDAVLLHLVLSVVPDAHAVASEVARVLTSDGRASIYDKFVPPGTRPSLIRRLLNPVARFLFSDITRDLGAILDGTGLEPGERESVVGGLYTVTIARPRAQAANREDG